MPILDQFIFYNLPGDLFGQQGYLVTHPRAGAAFLVDPGFGILAPLQNMLSTLKLRLDMVIVTHEHHDHIGNLNEVRAAFSCPIIASPACSANLGDTRKNLSAFHGPDGYCSAPADIELPEHPHQLEWHGREITFLPTPGHTPGSLCILMEDHLISGDTLIPGYKTVVTLPGSSREALAQSVHGLFQNLSGTTLVLPGHGAPFRLGDSSPDHHLGRMRPTVTFSP